MKIISITSLLVLSISVFAKAVPAPQDLYKEAQMQENTTRDPEAAIRLYEEFLKQPNNDRAMQSQAYLHLGFCQNKLGHTEEAKKAWKKIVQDYSDQSDSYAEALNQLQKMQVVERVIEVRTSTPVVKVVYSPPTTRWNLDFPRFAFNHTIDGKSDLITANTAGGSMGFSYFFQRRLGLDFELGNSGFLDRNGFRREINYLMPMVRAETPFWGPFAGYGKAGLGAYNFKFSDETHAESSPEFVPTSSRWVAGMLLEAGVVIGWYRGITFSLGYMLHAVPQATPSQDFKNAVRNQSNEDYSDFNQNHGLRFFGGPVLGLAFRW